MVIPYKQYHLQSMIAKDVDPSILALKYIADRYELNLEQRYWLAFLYGTCYCAPTTFYIYNEFPDFENVNISRLKRWWISNKHRTVFQTDRQRIKSNDQFVDCFKSYRKLVKTTQQNLFRNKGVDQIYKQILEIKYFGRFSLFNYLDVLNQITDVTAQPKYLNMIEAESCRKGVAYSIEREDLVKKLNKPGAVLLHNTFLDYLKQYPGNVFQIETTLCAYHKYRKGQRYIGYYIDRNYKEIKKLEETVKEGVYWGVLWDFRKETFDKQFLQEYK